MHDVSIRYPRQPGHPFGNAERARPLLDLGAIAGAVEPARHQQAHVEPGLEHLRHRLDDVVNALAPLDIADGDEHQAVFRDAEAAARRRRRLGCGLEIGLIDEGGHLAQLAARHPVPIVHEPHGFFVVTNHPIVHEPMQLIVQAVRGRDARHAVEHAQQCAERMGAAHMGVNGVDAATAAELSEPADLLRHASQRGSLDLDVARHRQDRPEIETRPLQDDDLVPAQRQQAGHNRRIADGAVDGISGMNLQNSHVTPEPPSRDAAMISLRRRDPMPRRIRREWLNISDGSRQVSRDPADGSRNCLKTSPRV